MNPRALAALAAWAAAASAQQPPAPPVFAAPNLTPAGVRAMAANCAPCHGTDGRPAAGSSVAPLAGRAQDEIVATMQAFREGRRESTVMQQIAKGYTDVETAAIAAYFARQR